jgi:predicted Zn-dependent protease
VNPKSHAPSSKEGCEQAKAFEFLKTHCGSCERINFELEIKSMPPQRTPPSSNLNFTAEREGSSYQAFYALALLAMIAIYFHAL